MKNLMKNMSKMHPSKFTNKSYLKMAKLENDDHHRVWTKRSTAKFPGWLQTFIEVNASN